MLRVAEYRKNAEECRRLATKAAAERVRDELLKMATIWTKIADDRERKLSEQKQDGVPIAKQDGAPPPN